MTPARKNNQITREHLLMHSLKRIPIKIMHQWERDLNNGGGGEGQGRVGDGIGDYESVGEIDSDSTFKTFEAKPRLLFHLIEITCTPLNLNTSCSR